MPTMIALDYYHGREAEPFTFYRIPKALFTDQRFRHISAEAKVLYGLFLDRMSLSVKNGWMDAEDRVFIYFTLEDAIKQLCCGHTKAVALFSEVEKVGLIERKKQGQGKPTKIYVKNFITGGEVQTSQKRMLVILIRIILNGTILIYPSAPSRVSGPKGSARRWAG